MAFPTQKQESFLWAHVQAFKHFGGVPHRISYDNLGTAVKLVFEKTGKAVRTRQEVRAFVAFRSYYLFDSHFCTVGQGHEKGQVESAVGYSRRNFLVPPPQCTSFEDLNQQLLARCLKEDQRPGCTPTPYHRRCMATGTSRAVAVACLRLRVLCYDNGKFDSIQSSHV